DKDMVAVPIGPKLRMAAVASPAYFARHPVPETPRDLVAHRCINLRFPTHGGLYVWEFERRGEQLNVRVDGQIILNSTPHIVLAALEGLGIAFLPEAEFAPHVEEGGLVRVLEDWCEPFEGYYLYYPSRRQPSPAFSLVVDALRFATTGVSKPR
ncbi:MAG: LysR substrate-binding domain-containing protein, partial [Gammaproteobacteria bacterium]